MCRNVRRQTRPRRGDDESLCPRPGRGRARSAAGGSGPILVSETVNTPAANRSAKWRGGKRPKPSGTPRTRSTLSPLVGRRSRWGGIGDERAASTKALGHRTEGGQVFGKKDSCHHRHQPASCDWQDDIRVDPADILRALACAGAERFESRPAVKGGVKGKHLGGARGDHFRHSRAQEDFRLGGGWSRALRGRPAGRPPILPASPPVPVCSSAAGSCRRSSR